jgi:hypothetical protein
MAIKEDYEELMVEIKREFPDFDVIKKTDSKLMKLIDVFLKMITFGQMKTFMTSFITTLGANVYVTEKWEFTRLVDKVEVLRHERIHMRQAKKYGRFLFSFLYLLFPLPVGLAYFRKKFEQEAYEESIRAIYQYHGEKAASSLQVKEFIISQFTTANYFWMWPFKKSVEEWYDATIKKIISGN